MRLLPTAGDANFRIGRARRICRYFPATKGRAAASPGQAKDHRQRRPGAKSGPRARTASASLTHQHVERAAAPARAKQRGKITIPLMRALFFLGNLFGGPLLLYRAHKELNILASIGMWRRIND